MSTQNSQNPIPIEFSGMTQAGIGKFPHPFFDYASEFIPRDMNTNLMLCEYLFLTFGTFRSAARRVVRYFLTELVLQGESDNEREKYEEFMYDDLHIMQELAAIGDDFLAYGNVFISLYFPFDRYLICPKCKTEFHIDAMKPKFDARKLCFSAKCHKCNFTGVMQREDRRSTDEKRVRLIRWNPKQIKIRVHPVSGKTDYFYEFDPTFTEKLAEGNPFFLNDTPWSMIECALKGRSQGIAPLFKFKDDALYHFRDSTLSGLPIKGWAVPPIMSNFKLVYYIHMLRRYDEAIALDFIMPFRVMFPQANGPTDPLGQTNMNNFTMHLRRLVENKRKGMFDIQFAPFPIGYEMLGGEAAQLAPKETIGMAIDEFLNAMGFPAQLYKGDLTIQAAPMALRLFEKTWGHWVEGCNDFLSWLIKRLARHFMWGEIDCTLRSVTLADDIERKALALQAAAGMDISKQTAYLPLGIDFKEEQRRVLEEQEMIQKLQQEAMDRQQAATDPNAPPPQQGGMPGGPGGLPGSTPGDIQAQAQETANYLLFQVPETMRRGEIIKIKHSNPTLHALVLQAMDTVRQDMARQGQAQMMQQQKTATAMPDETEAELRKLPSPTLLNLQISDQICEWNRSDLQKVAMDIKRGVKGAEQAFHWIYSKVVGWS